MKGLAKEHICVSYGHRQSCSEGQGEGSRSRVEVGTGRGGEGGGGGGICNKKIVILEMDRLYHPGN